MTSRSDILFINRDSDFLEAMAGFLRKAGFVVHTAMDMRNALAKMSENPVGLIICDNVLQDISGYDFLRFIKNDPLRESIPFIFFVPINDQGRAAKAFELGAADFLVYPMDVDDLANRVQEIIVPGEDDPASAAPDVEHQSSAAIPSAEQRDFPSVNHSAPGSILPSPVVPMQLFPSVRIDLSRDGLLWMPGNVKNLFTNGILVVTALLGKPGVRLHVKFPLPEGRLTIRGQIKQVVFDNFDKPAGIGITFEKSPQWTQVLEHLQSLMEKEEGRVAADIPHTQLRLCSKEMSVEMTGTLLLPGGPEELSTTLVLHTTDDGVKSYHERFYHSLVGKQLDSYRALSFIGAGTMGGVFKGWDAALERIVALKVISYELSAREEFRKLFIKEARLISQLDYPNIAHIYAIGNTNDILYFAMEFINGETLGDLIKKHGNLYTLRGLDYLITVCTTLDFVSGQNIIHRDIKPENII
ncbi:MAG TPA: response regulator, partial [Thermodesulfobacteriota bacterium]|nr:response regulator [Thermodesulfobacteriota bacterium]